MSVHRPWEMSFFTISEDGENIPLDTIDFGTVWVDTNKNINIYIRNDETIPATEIKYFHTNPDIEITGPDRLMPRESKPLTLEWEPKEGSMILGDSLRVEAVLVYA